jgi:hypothetical protein
VTFLSLGTAKSQKQSYKEKCSLKENTVVIIPTLRVTVDESEGRWKRGTAGIQVY